MFLNDIPGSMIYFLIYESTSDYLRDHYNILLCNEPLYSCLLGGTAGTIAYFPLAPLDHVQTKMMSDKKQKCVIFTFIVLLKNFTFSGSCVK